MKGILSPRYKHGRYSKYMPTRLLNRYAEAIDDPELLAMKEDIGLIDARIADVLGRVDTGEAGLTWKTLKTTYSDFKDAMRLHDGDRMAVDMQEIEKLLGKGYGDYVAWSEVTSLLEQRRRLVESERKRLVEMKQMITVEDTLSLIMRITNVIKETITDPAIQHRIGRELISILSAGGVPAALRFGGGDNEVQESRPDIVDSRAL